MLFEDLYGENNEEIRHVALQFTSDGQAKCVGIFNDYAAQIKQ